MPDTVTFKMNNSKLGTNKPRNKATNDLTEKLQFEVDPHQKNGICLRISIQWGQLYTNTQKTKVISQNEFTLKRGLAFPQRHNDNNWIQECPK